MVLSKSSAAGQSTETPARAERRALRTVTTGGRAGIQKGGAPLPASGVMLQHHRDANAAAAAPTRTTRARATAAAAEVVVMGRGGHECVLSTV